MLTTKRKIALWLCAAAMLCCAVAGMLFARPHKARAATTDYTTQEFLETFTVSGATKSFENGELTVQITKSTAYAQVNFATVSGSRWYVSSLTTRGTLMLRLKNETAATQATVQFTTRTKTTYDAEREVSFPLQTDGEYHLYYVDLTQCPNATGELRGIRLKLNGAEEGSYSIDHISFEREQIADHSVGRVDSCTADGVSVTVTGTLAAGHENATVDLYVTGIENMNEELDAAHARKIASFAAQGSSFRYSFPFADGNVSMLSSKFLAAVNGVKLGRAFDIENWRDFTENPYEFTLKNTVVNVLDRGAKGDGVTDDTAIIQAAIDEVSLSGGGMVVLAGDDSAYGRRYVATTVRLKDNVELRIEENAVLWQSRNESDYTYDYKKGHDAEGITWGHNALAYNYPLVYAANASNIKLTGGGTVRLLDMGSGAATDAYSEKYGNYCASLIHLIPVGLYNCTNVEVTDITILRTNCYHMVVYGCENVYLGNLNLTECNCLSGDGISIGAGSKNVIVDRCFIYGNDDAIVLVSHSIGEQRGQTWWQAKPDGGDNRLRNVTVRHSAITPGNCIVFVAWGTDASDLTLQAIDGVYVYDNILGARYATAWSGSHVVNVWAGQGASGNNNYGAAGSTVPVHNVRILHNSYRGIVSNVGVLEKTNWVTDCGSVSVQTAFADPAFTQKLASWEYGGEYKQNVSLANGKAFLNLDGALCEQYGTPSIYQGLSLKAGSYTFSANVEREGGAECRLFVRDAYTGTLLFEQSAAEGANTLAFQTEREGVYLIGVEANGQTGTALVSALNLAGTGDDAPLYPSYDFENGTGSLECYGWAKTENEGISYLAPEADGKGGTVRLKGSYENFDLKFEYKPTETDGKTLALSGWVAEFGSNVQRYRLEYSAQEGGVTLFYVREKERVGNTAAEAQTTVLATAACELALSNWVQIGLRVKNGAITLFVDGEQLFKANGESVQGSVRLSFYNSAPALDNLVLGEAESLEYERSEHWTELPEEETPPAPDDTGNGDTGKKGCASAAFGGGMVATALALMLAAGWIVIAKRVKK